MTKLGRLDAANAGAVAASFGAVSSATLMVAISLVETLGIPYEKFVPALDPFMDVSGVVTAIVLAGWALGRQRQSQALHASSVSGISTFPVLGSPESPASIPRVKASVIFRNAVTNTGVYVTLGALIIGMLVGSERLEREMRLFDAMFRGAICLFLLDMGVLAASRLKGIKVVSPLIIPFALVIPLLNGALAVIVGTFLGLSPGGAFVFSSLAAGASYISAPAVIRAALPEANPSLYLGGAIGIIFPFNVAIGLPVLLQFALFLGN